MLADILMKGENMSRYKLGSVVLSMFLYFNSLSSAASATRTWVSGVGDDAYPCSRTAPCKTFAGAIAKTEPGGEIDCLDPGGFGAVTITNAITIYCKNIDGGVLVSGTNGILISANPTDHVVLDGLNIEGTGSGLSGINILSAAAVTITNSSIRNFVTSGINVAPSSSPTNVTVINTIITGNATGLSVDASHAAATAGLVNSVITGNTNNTSTINGGKIVSYAAGNVIKE